MAKFNATGIEGLQLSMEEFAKIPDEVVEEMLEAGGKVTVEAHKRKLESLGLFNPRSKAFKHLKDSIKALSKVRTRDGERQRYVIVYPQGKHHTYNRKKVTKEYKNSKSGRTYTVGGDIKNVSAGEVGFVLEYGAPKRGIKSYQWMRKANEESADAVVAAEMEVYDRWLDSLGL